MALGAAAATFTVLAQMPERAATEKRDVKADAHQRDAVIEAYARLPLTLEENVGQADPGVRFLGRTEGGTVFLTSTAAVLATKGGDLRFGLEGANPSPTLEALGPQSGQVNYLRGADPGGWHRNVPAYGQARYGGVYPGIDLIWHGARGTLEYDFVVQPGADPNIITLAFEGASTLRLEATGDLVATVGGTELRQSRPEIYQDIGGRRHQVTGAFALRQGGAVGFAIGTYDRTAPLVIDPLVYATYLGGTGGDEFQGVAIDSGGNAYVVGTSNSDDYPIVPGALRPTRQGNDIVVTKFNPTASSLVYSTYLGGSSGDNGVGIGLDGAGNAIVAGKTQSTDFPTTAGALQTGLAGSSDVVVAKLNSDGSALLYSTYLGGTGSDSVADLAVDSAANAYVAGLTFSTDFPTSAGAFRTGPAGGSEGFVAKIPTTGSGAGYASYLGGNDSDDMRGIAVDGAGHAYITGQSLSSNFPITAGAYRTEKPSELSGSGVVVKLNPAGSDLVYATWLGGSGQTSPADIAVDESGNAYVAGSTQSSTYPTTAGAFQVSKPNPALTSSPFVTKLNPSGSAIVYSTWLGGANGADVPNVITVDPSGSAHVAGGANSTNFPLVNPVQATHGGAFYDAFVSVLNPSGTALTFSTYLGGTDTESPKGLAVDGSGNVYVAGTTFSTNFPTTPGVIQPAKVPGDQNDGFLAKISVGGGNTQPIISGSTWYSDGANSKSGPAGSEVRAYAVGAFTDLAYRFILATSGCTTEVAVLNPNNRFANSSGFISTTVGTIPSTVAPGDYVVCFKSTVGDPPTATGTVSFTVTS